MILIINNHACYFDKLHDIKRMFECTTAITNTPMHAHSRLPAADSDCATRFFVGVQVDVTAGGVVGGPAPVWNKTISQVRESTVHPCVLCDSMPVAFQHQSLSQDGSPRVEAQKLGCCNY